MSRIKNQEIIRRTATASRLSNTPDLAVQADLDSSRGYQALSNVAIDTLGRVAQSYQAISRVKDEGEQQAGASARNKADLEGAAPVAEDALAQQTKSWRRGYMKADAAIKVRDWQRDMTVELSKAEPGTDIEPILKERLSELTGSPEFQDPAVQKEMLPALQRAADNIRGAYQKVEINEIFTRQKESLTVIARQGVADGSLLTPQGTAKFYAALDTEQFAYLSGRDADAVVVDGITQALQSGEADPAKTLEFLKTFKVPGRDVTLLDTEHGDDILAAVKAGEAVRQKKLDAVIDQRMADKEFEWSDRVERGQMTDTFINQQVEELGLQGKDALSFRRYWRNQNDATLAKWEREAEERRKELERKKELGLTGNIFAMTDSQAQKLANKDWESTPPAGRGALIRKWAQYGITIPQVENVLRRATPAAPELWKQATEMYATLKAIDPIFASRHVGVETAGLLETHWRNTHRSGMSDQESIRALGADKVSKADSLATIKAAWKEGTKPYLNSPTGQPRSVIEFRRIHETAQRIHQANPQISGEDAIAAAVGIVDTQFTTVKGRRVPNIGMPKGAEQATEALIDEVEKQRGLTGLSAAPNPKAPGQWQIVNGRGFPVVVGEGDKRGYVAFDPRRLANSHQKWTADHAEYQARVAQARKSGNFVSGKAPHERTKAEAPLQFAPTYEPGKGIPLDTLGKTVGQRPDDGYIPAVPDSFLDYLKETR